MLQKWLALACWLGCAGAAVAEPPQITWAMVDWPPLMVLKDGKAPATAQDLGNGAIDQVIAELIPHMPEYQHSFRLFNRQRVLHLMEAGQSFCYPSAFKTREREAYAYFVPIMLVSPVALVTREGIKVQLGAKMDAVKLADVLKNPAWVGHMEATRSYGPALDQVLAAAPTAPVRDVVKNAGDLLRPLSSGRFDYTLEYPMVVEYARRQGQLIHPLEVTPLVEVRDWPVGYVACTRNPWGQAAARAIDAAAQAAAKTERYRKLFTQWMPADMAQSNRAQVEAFYDLRARTRSSFD